MNGRSTISRIVAKPPCIGRRSAVPARAYASPSFSMRSDPGGEPLAVALVDPVPGEVAHRDRGQAGRVAAATRQRRDVADDRAVRRSSEPPRLVSPRARQAARERPTHGDGRGLVQAQAVDLHDAGVALERVESTGRVASGRTAIAAPTSERRPRIRRRAPSALSTSMSREAWPKPWPEM